MIYTKTNPVGIDKKIQRLQEYLYTKLVSLYNVNYESFGRVEIVKKNNQELPAFFTSGKDYKEVLPNDKTPLNSFFLVTDTLIGDRYQAEVDLYYFCNLATIKPLITHRADAEVERELSYYIEKNNYGIKITGMEKGAQVYEAWNIDKPIDMHPFHSFKFSLSFSFENTLNCN